MSKKFKLTSEQAWWLGYSRGIPYKGITAELWMETMDRLYPETVAKYKKIKIIAK
jgi:hypothetical protein